MFKFITSLKAVLVNFTTSKLKTKQDRKLSKLLNFENLKAKLFYQILNSTDLSLLNPKNIKVSEEQLTNLWYQILERYYRETDESKYAEFVNSIRKKTERQNEMMLIEAAWILSILGDENAQRILDEKGVSNQSKLQQLRTKYRMFVAKEALKQKEKSLVDFYELLSNVSISEKIHLNSDMLLVEWIGIIKSVRRNAEIRKKQANMIQK